MKATFYLNILCIIALIILLNESCTYNHLPESNNTIILNWYTQPANQTKEEFTTGLIWLFSYLGAKLPQNQFDEAIKFIASNKVEVNFEKLGFPDFSLKHIDKLTSLIKETEEYEKTGGIDAGRFFGLCFNSSFHYYKITGAKNSFSQFKSKFNSFVYKTFACDTSAVAYSSRFLYYNVENSSIFQNLFFAQEGKGYFSEGNFVKSEIIEAFDYMENGQPRFAIYNENGQLYAPNNPLEHPAGKPAKCMWCHESGMQPLIFPTPDISGYETSETFTQDQKVFTNRLKEFHKNTNSKLDFSQKQNHSQGELIYLQFYEPTVARLSQEWQLSENTVKKMLAGIPLHHNHEYPFLKEVYHRKDIEKYAPFKSIAVTDEMRESSFFEPDYLN